MATYIFDTFRRQDSNPAVQNVYSRRLVGRTSDSGHTWARFGSNLTAPYYDRVGVYSTVGLQSSPKFTYNGVLYTAADFPDPTGSTTNLAHPTTLGQGNTSLYYTDALAPTFAARVAIRFTMTAFWYGLYKADTAAIPSVVLHLNPNTGSCYVASFEPRTAGWNFQKYVNGVVVDTAQGSLRPSNYYPTNGSWSLNGFEENAGIELEMVASNQVAIRVYWGNLDFPTYRWTTVAVYADATPLAPGYTGIRTALTNNWGGSSLQWFGASYGAGNLAGGGFDSGRVLSDPYAVQSAGYTTLEGEIKPYVISWKRTLIDGNSTTTQMTTQADGSLLDVAPPYNPTWNGSTYVNGPTTYEYTQRITDLRTRDTLLPFGILPTIEGSFRVTLVPPDWPTTVPPNGTTGQVVIPNVKRTVGTKARIIGTPLNNNGIQTFSLGESTSNPGRNDLLQHPDGNLYMVYAESVTGLSEERCLYMISSADNGATWSTPFCLTSGAWDDAPAIVTLDDTPTSNIGIVFNRAPQYWASGIGGFNTGGAPLIYRMVVDTTGTLIGGIDPITDTLSLMECPTVVRKNDGFLIAAVPGFRGGEEVYFWENPDFSTNNWTRRLDLNNNLASIAGWSNAQRTVVESVRLLMLSNGDILLLLTAASDMNNKSLVNSGFTAPPRNWRRFDLYTLISTDQGDTWGTIQKLTNYTNAPTTALTPTYGVNSADAVEMADGRLAVMYSEASHTKEITATTNAGIAPAARVRVVKYLASKQLLLLGTEGDGFYALNLVTNANKKLSIDTSPAIWGNIIRCIAVNPSGTRIALGTTTSLEIIDISDPNPANWTTSVSLRGTTIPALRTPYIAAVQFVNDTTLYTFYGGNGSGVANIIGAKFNLSLTQSDSGFMTDITVAGAGTRVPDYADVLTIGNFLIVKNTSNTLVAVPFTSGYTGTTCTGGSALGGAYAGKLFYDPYNKELLYPNNTGYQLRRFTPTLTGTSITIVGNGAFTLTSNDQSSMIEPIDIGGNGILCRRIALNAANWMFWSYVDQRYVGVILRNSEDYQGTHLGNGQPSVATVSEDGRWLIIFSDTITGNAQFRMVDLQQSGVLKYAFFGYNQTTHTLTIPSTPVWTPAANPIRVGSDANYFVEPRLVRDSGDNLYISGLYFNLLAQQRPMARIFTRVSPDAYNLTVRGRIIAPSSVTITAKARLQKRQTATISVQTHINFAQCVKIQARIVPFQRQSVRARAAIYGQKLSTMTGAFSVRTNQQAILRGTFFVNTGYPKEASMHVRASVVRPGRALTEVSFSVKGTPVPNGIISVIVDQRNIFRLNVGAHITNV